MQFLRQSTATSVLIHNVMDTSGSAVTTLVAANTDVDLYKGFTKSDITDTDSGGNNDWTHIANGNYSLELTTSDTDTVGRLSVTVNATGVLPVWEDFSVLSQAVYDVLFGSVALSTFAGGAVASVTANVNTNANATEIAIAGYIDTEVAAIKAKTDNLPSDPADASDIAALFATVNGTLATIQSAISSRGGGSVVE